MKRKNLNPDKLRSYPGLENLTDKEAERLHDELAQLASILLRIYPPHLMEKEGSPIPKKTGMPCP